MATLLAGTSTSIFNSMNTHSLDATTTTGVYINDPGLNSPLDGQNIFFSAWIKTDATAGGHIAAKGCEPGSNGAAQWRFYVTDLGSGPVLAFNIFYYSAPNWIAVTTVYSSSVLTEEQWYHVGVYYAPLDSATYNNVRIYVNGAQDNTGDSGNPTIGQTPSDSGIAFTIGCIRNQTDTGFTGAFQGLIDEVTFTNSNYSQADANTHMAALYARRPTPSDYNAVYYFDNNLLDETSNSYDLTAVGTATYSTDHANISGFIPYIGAII